jgi:hypothetical protein
MTVLSEREVSEEEYKRLRDREGYDTSTVHLDDGQPLPPPAQREAPDIKLG